MIKLVGMKEMLYNKSLSKPLSQKTQSEHERKRKVRKRRRGGEGRKVKGKQEREELSIYRLHIYFINPNLQKASLCYSLL